MDGAFFVSRTELLSWANSFFALNLSKVEQCSNGAVYCQIIDASHPGAVQMRRVNWVARDEHQNIANYKVLQQAFDKVGISRHIEVDKLVRGKYQDNLEMLQWIKTYFDRTYQGGEYDPWARRAGDNLPEWAKASVCEGEAPPQQSPQPGRGSSGGLADRGPSPRHSTGPSAAADTRGSGYGRGSPAIGRGRGARLGGGTAPTAEFNSLRVEHERLRDEVVDLKITVDGLETERDFYFQKLRDIEILCQALESHTDPNMSVDKLVEGVQRILYAKDEDEEDGEETLDGGQGPLEP